MTTTAKVFVTRDLPGDALDRLRLACDVTIWPEDRPPSPQELRESVTACDGMLTLLSDRIDGSIMDAAGDGLKVISNYAVGFNNVDLNAARQRNVAVGNTPDVLTDATADIAVTLALAASRHIVPAYDSIRNGQWGAWQPNGWLGRQLNGGTLGIVGMGRIGAAVARRLHHGWNMNVVYTARSRHASVERELNAQRLDLDTLLDRSNVVSLHVPLDEQTRHLIDGPRLARMRESAILVNTARGEIIDQDALVTSLQKGHPFAAGLDVTTPEPLPQNHPLVSLPNVLITPHIGSATSEARQAMARIAVDNLIAGIRQRPLPHAVVDNDRS
ncbi:MAG: D-glycerate dehydrogenase [Planctomycetota bacterium]